MKKMQDFHFKNFFIEEYNRKYWFYYYELLYYKFDFDGLDTKLPMSHSSVHKLSPK